MNLYDKAHELGKALKESEEVIQLNNVSKKINKNDLNKKMLNDFRKLQYEAYSEQVTNGKLSKKMEGKLKNLSSIISMNPEINAYFQVEMRFRVIWEDIIKILNEAIDIDLTFGIGK
ncbi:cell fate (sporulation/competence/biofilm development) regulator YlbF (YheA/YmcA/DUF963 family) [Clostridium tetanomorphum]|uniref:YlbF family regulator n=1 Tax=Clostridium tetanomorphum TaxID=1553 RepID=A0A923J1F5_CLOTT|nr:YlbF family regulator [Clostridium tetanomorphum]KAJ52822.1 hypothetical protein CTM_05805 [Clostridium tetanomorphum DSM 665]MBC2399191.1 YlbF family regulator [Clostridium tetanomorphum]MBP1865407.1 cell fate (sporulation/competence/biofilm development) regulator YlbF (YheA/YmcA/DUF963 family) [Clostridium tetanomorphum]NRS84826.1 cell fate (sporulation/competence/biofilm development) regulator YlbF (YheA/YmcA/DUF963 family) [Clostridium tetanomorphum]NRZ98043.1 cell fate (sporulation/com